MSECVGLFIVFTTIVFGVIAVFGFDLCFKEKAKLFADFEIFLALLTVGVYILVE